MSPALLVDAGLALLVVVIAAWAVTVRQTYAAIVGFVSYGLLLALVWVRLAAPDVAMTEAAIGSGLTGMLLLGAAARLQHTEARTTPEQRSERLAAAPRAVAALFSAGIAVAIAAALLLLPEPAPTLAMAAQQNLPATGLGNPVAGTLFAFRALDTLLEKIVLVLALLGVWSLTGDDGAGRLWGGVPRVGEIDGAEWRSGALTLLAQVLPPVGIVVGLYLAWNGANNPGGAFQGSTVIAAMWLLVMVAGLAPPPAIGGRRLRLAVAAGPLAFAAIGLAGIATAGAFLAYPEGAAKAHIVVIEAVLTLSIAATLAMLVAGPAEREPAR